MSTFLAVVFSVLEQSRPTRKMGKKKVLKLAQTQVVKNGASKVTCKGTHKNKTGHIVIKVTCMGYKRVLQLILLTYIWGELRLRENVLATCVRNI